MSRFVKVGMIALAAVGFTATVSSAADLDLPAPIIEHNPVVKSSAGGFYLRGDIGYSIWKSPDLSDTVGGGRDQHFDEEAGNSLFAGVGVGYDFKKYLRTDITFDIRKGEDIEASAPCGTCVLAGLPGFTSERTSLSSYTVLANAYLDAGEFYGFTPYIGAGVGGAFLDFGSYTSSGNPAPQPPVDVFSANDSFRFAWALHAGTSYAINDNLSFDAGYRYLNVNGGELVDTGSGVVDYDDLQAHEVRLGFRYTFGGGHGGDSYSAPSPIFK